LFFLAVLFGVLAVSLDREGEQRHTLVAGTAVVGCVGSSVLGLVAIIAAEEPHQRCEHAERRSNGKQYPVSNLERTGYQNATGDRSMADSASPHHTSTSSGVGPTPPRLRPGKREMRMALCPPSVSGTPRTSAAAKCG
jgi:hypothetical protein